MQPNACFFHGPFPNKVCSVSSLPKDVAAVSFPFLISLLPHITWNLRIFYSYRHLTTGCFHALAVAAI